MVFFFALITKEVVEATAPGGVLHPWRRALLPVIACDRRHDGSRADSTYAWSTCSTSLCWRSAGRSRSRLISRSATSSRESSSGRTRRSRFCCCCAIASDALGILALAICASHRGRPARQRRADHGRRDRRGLRAATGTGKKLLAVRARRRQCLVVRDVLERPRSSARSRSDRAFPAPRRARPGILCRRTARPPGIR